MNLEYITPNWSVPKNIHCVTTTRKGGYSLQEYSSLNLGGHVKDKQKNVKSNRCLIEEDLQLPNEPVWLEQVHGASVLSLPAKNHINNTADAAYTDEEGIVCTVLTADCLPVTFCDQSGEHIAVAHAGWRGLVNGVLENTLQTIPVNNKNITCWLGPAIGPNKFEIGIEVVKQFLTKDKIHSNAFEESNNKYFADIYRIARNILAKQNVFNVCGGEHCTFSEKESFYSYRRDGETGRMATLIWIA